MAFHCPGDCIARGNGIESQLIAHRICVQDGIEVIIAAFCTESRDTFVFRSFAVGRRIGPFGNLIKAAAGNGAIIATFVLGAVALQKDFPFQLIRPIKSGLLEIARR